jgi:hypothetical protein
VAHLLVWPSYGDNTYKCNSFLHVGVEAGDEARPGPWDLSDQGAAPSRGEGVDWLVKDQVV